MDRYKRKPNSGGDDPERDVFGINGESYAFEDICKNGLDIFKRGKRPT
ncbi:MAG: hypothetical protein MPJ06_01225 [Nitrosopumilus sp.]|nr:hypothetical protein [Nitrosopumilus sp.]MDA7942617.1 hypothetical protein [Nitrosopumilus sp.]